MRGSLCRGEVRQIRDTVDNCLRGSSVIHHVCQAVQMSMAVSKKGWECYFEGGYFRMHLIQQNNLTEGLPCSTASEIMKGTLSTLARKSLRFSLGADYL